MTEELVRDDELGAAIRALPVPEHLPGFWDRSEIPQVPRWRRPGAVLTIIAAAAVVVVGVATFAVGRSGEDPVAVATSGPKDAVMLTGTIRGEEKNASGLHTFTQRFTLAVDGSSSLVMTDGTSSRTFDAVTRRRSEGSAGSGGELRWVVYENAEPRPATLTKQLGQVPPAADLSEGEATTFLGRDARRIVKTGTVQEPGGRAVMIEYVTDTKTGMVLRYESSVAGEVVSRFEVLDLAESDSIDRSRFRVAIPGGHTIESTSDERFKLVEFEEVDGDGERLAKMKDLRTIVGYDVQPPMQLGSFELDSVVARSGTAADESADRTAVDSDRVQLIYRDGWRSIEVVIRRSAGGAPATDAPPWPVVESALRVAGFAITVRGDVDEPRRADIVGRINAATRKQ